MPIRDVLLIVGICFAWAANTFVSSYALTAGSLTAAGIPPLFFASLRFLVVTVATLPWLLPLPRPPGRMMLVALLVGFGHFGLTLVGLHNASLAGAGIVFQAGPPLTVLLSVILLGERLSAGRVAGLCLASGGVLVAVYDPAGLRSSAGLLYILAGQFTFALASVAMKKLPHVAPLQYQACVGIVSVPTLFAMSLLLETGQTHQAMAGGWPLAGCALFSGLVASVWAHTRYFTLMHRYDVSLIGPLTLLSPILTILLGIVVRHDPFNLRLGLSACAALLGVLLMMLSNARASKISAADELESNVST